MRHPPDWSFLFHRATKGIVFKAGMFFRQNTLAERKEEDFFGNLKGSEHTWSKHYHTFALMNNRPNKGDSLKMWNNYGRRNGKGHR